MEPRELTGGGVTDRVVCAQFRYTWAHRRLDRSSGGFGVVLRSADWPAELVDPPALRELLTTLSTAARGESAGAATARVAHLRLGGGSLLVAKRAVGTDGAGRPGNFAVHALYDPTATLGALDLAPLLADGTLRLDRDVDVEPDGAAPGLPVPVPAGWARTRSGEPAEVYGDDLRYPDSADWAGLLAGLVRRLPADLVDQLPLRAGDPDRVTGAVDALIERFRPAVALGAADHASWYERHGRTAAEWEAELDHFLTQNRPVGEVADDRLWTRWDGANARGRTAVARELLRRPGLATSAAAVAELSQRPPLVDTLLEVGVRGRPRERAVAADWVAAAGDEGQVIDLAAELLAAGGTLPRPLLDRLQLLPPDRLPAVVLDEVVRQVDAGRPLAAGWRTHCVRLLVSDRPSCAEPAELVTSCSDAELVSVLTTAGDAAAAARAWRVLSAWLPTDRLTEVFVAAGPVPASHLLHAPLGSGSGRPSPALVRAWPRLAETLGWSEGLRTLLPRLVRAELTLRRQRLLLLIAAGVLALAVVALALVIGLTPALPASR